MNGKGMRIPMNATRTVRIAKIEAAEKLNDNAIEGLE